MVRIEQKNIFSIKYNIYEYLRNISEYFKFNFLLKENTAQFFKYFFFLIQLIYFLVVKYTIYIFICYIKHQPFDSIFSFYKSDLFLILYFLSPIILYFAIEEAFEDAFFLSTYYSINPLITNIIYMVMQWFVYSNEFLSLIYFIFYVVMFMITKYNISIQYYDKILLSDKERFFFEIKKFITSAFFASLIY